MSILTKLPFSSCWPPLLRASHRGWIRTNLVEARCLKMLQSSNPTVPTSPPLFPTSSPHSLLITDQASTSSRLRSRSGVVRCLWTISRVNSAEFPLIRATSFKYPTRGPHTEILKNFIPSKYERNQCKSKTHFVFKFQWSSLPSKKKHLFCKIPERSTRRSVTLSAWPHLSSSSDCPRSCSASALPIRSLPPGLPLFHC